MYACVLASEHARALVRARARVRVRDVRLCHGFAAAAAAAAAPPRLALLRRRHECLLPRRRTRTLPPPPPPPPPPRPSLLPGHVARWVGVFLAWVRGEGRGLAAVVVVVGEQQPENSRPSLLGTRI